jgi:hypothetical protein
MGVGAMNDNVLYHAQSWAQSIVRIAATEVRSTKFLETLARLRRPIQERPLELATHQRIARDMATAAQTLVAGGSPESREIREAND